MLIVRLENKSGQELFVVKLECNNHVSVAVCRRDSFTTRQFKVEDLICDTSQICLRNNAFIFFKRVTPSLSAQLPHDIEKNDTVQLHSGNTTYSPHPTTIPKHVPTSDREGVKYWLQGTRAKCGDFFFPSNAFMASARSFSTFNCMLQIRFQF